MFSNNNKISIRQVYRLFVFDFIGMSTLVLPAKLSGATGCDGVFAIVIGGVFASVYLWYLSRIMRGMDSDLISYTRTRLPRWGAIVMMVSFAVYCVLVAAFGAYIFADVMKVGLIGNESYTLLLILILAVAVYAIQSGIESRARVYEVLFWVLFIPLLLLLIIAASDTTPEYLGSFFSSTVSDVAWSGTGVFYFLMPVFLILFFPAYIRKERQKSMVSAVAAALWSAVVVLAVFYLILLGSFGERALADMRYPALTLMSNIHLRGSFLKRLDAFLLAIWFFTLFALINVYLFYAEKLLSALGGLVSGHQQSFEQKEPQKRSVSIGITVVIVFAVAEWFCYGSLTEWFELYIAYVGAPLLVVLPLVIVLWGKVRNNAKKNGL